MDGFSISHSIFEKLTNEQKADYLLWYSEELDKQSLKKLEKYRNSLHPSVYRSMLILLKKDKLNVEWDVIDGVSKTQMDFQVALWNIVKKKIKEFENDFVNYMRISAMQNAYS